MGKSGKKYVNASPIPPSGWLYKADVSWILNNRNISNRDKAGRMVKILEDLELFRKREYNTVISALVEGAKSGNSAFESAVEVLYNVCDYHRIWLAA
jgi:hypothetical protein